MTTIPAPYPYFTDAAGNALEAGKVYIGTAGLDPRTNPIAVYQDEALTIAWAQPIRTVGGYPVYIGAPSNIYTAALEFSLIVATSTGEVVFRDLNVVSIDAANIRFIQAGVGAVARSAQDKMRDVVSVKDFGAVGDGVADDTAEIQAALNTGLVIYFPAGTYKTSAAINITNDFSGIVGDGFDTIIAPANTTGDVFTIGDGVNGIDGLLFEKFTIWPSVAKISGYAFNARLTKLSTWNNVYVGRSDFYATDGHRLYDGYYFDRFGQATVNCGEVLVSNDGVKARGNADQSFGAELSLDGNLRIFKCAGKGVWLGGAAGGVYLGRMDVSECGTGVYCDSTLQAGVQNRELFLGPMCTIDSCTGWGVQLAATSLAILEATGAWIAGCGDNATSKGGILVEASSGVSAKWSNLRVYANKYDGVVLNSGTHVFSGGQVLNSGGIVVGANGGNGFTVGAAIGNLIITGMMIHNNGNGTRGTGIALNAAANNFNIQSNALFSNGVTSGTASNATLTQIVRDNRGWVTENSGTATITTGNSTVVVNHGLADTPTFVDVGFAGPMDSTSVYVYAAPGSFTSTQFTITYSAAAGVNRSFWWRATRGQA